MDKQVEQSLRAIDDSIKEILGKISAQDMLIQQAYAQWFLANPDARKSIPGQFTGSMRFNATSPTNSANAMEIQSRAVKHLEKFFADVKQRVEETEWARQRQQGTN